MVFLLLAGEIYTTFALLGGSGRAYGEGRGPAFYILSCGRLALRQGASSALAVGLFVKEYES